MRVASTDGVSLAVHDLGGEGPPLLICHATGFCGMTYRRFAEGLTGIRHVWAIDFRGHGDSTSPESGDFDWGGDAEDLLAVVDALGAAPVDVVGHSMGGAAAVLAEERRPGTLRSAYLFEPIIPPLDLPETGADNPMAVAARKRRAVFDSKAEALYRYATKTPLAALNAGALGDYVEHGFEDLRDGTARLKLDPEEEAAVFSASGKATAVTAKSVAVPVTVAVGVVPEGEFSPALFAEPLVEALPDGRLVRFDDLGHFGPLEAPSIVAADVRRWLSNL
jgi:pimeloyl-ACP methyl ester carboxylesterase